VFLSSLDLGACGLTNLKYGFDVDIDTAVSGHLPGEMDPGRPGAAVVRRTYGDHVAPVNHHHGTIRTHQDTHDRRVPASDRPWCLAVR